MGVSRTSRSLSQRQRNFANIYTHTGLARILKQGKINTKIDPKMAKIGVVGAKDSSFFFFFFLIFFFNHLKQTFNNLSLETDTFVYCHFLGVTICHLGLQCGNR